MRQHLALAMVAGLVHLAAPVQAQPAKKSTHAKRDLKPHLADLVVYEDDVGKFYVTPQPGSVAAERKDVTVYFGDGKVFYEQQVVGSHVSRQPARLEWNLWSPRVRSIRFAKLILTPDDLYVQCAVKEKRPLTQLSHDAARKMLASAAFYEPFWKRETRFLARDEDGTYYFVDQFREIAGGAGYRVFVGKKGAMKELPMTNLVSDSAGDIYATKSGELKFITEGGKAFWKKGGKRHELVVLPPVDNRYLIYRELGVYGQLGVVCEDQ